jgi:hypothetical protein
MRCLDNLVDEPDEPADVDGFEDAVEVSILSASTASVAGFDWVSGRSAEIRARDPSPPDGSSSLRAKAKERIALAGARALKDC